MTGFAEVLSELDRADLRLRRAWPRSAEHLLLDLDDIGADARVAAQWFADPQVAERVASDTPGAQRRGRVVLHPDGADRKLRPLAELLREPGSRLVGHRPERRAVVAREGGARFTKIVPAGRVARLRDGMRRIGSLPIRTPRLDPTSAAQATDHSMVTTRAMPGAPLSELIAGPVALEALRAVGIAIARLHRCEPLTGTPVHGPSAELAVTANWERSARAFGLSLSYAANSWPAPPPPPTLRLIHRDLHDGQLLLAADANGRLSDAGVGILDFDLMAAGDPALDLANLIEHLQLRARQGVIDDADGAVNALLHGYRPDAVTVGRVRAYRELAARRLAAVYAFRATDIVT